MGKPNCELTTKHISVEADVMVGSKSISSIRNYLQKHSRSSWLYIIWILINCIFWIISVTQEDRDVASEYFIVGNHGFSITYYDLTEFLFFVIIVPGLLYGIKKLDGISYIKKILANSLSTAKRPTVKRALLFTAMLAICVASYMLFLHIGLSISLGMAALVFLKLFVDELNSREKYKYCLFAFFLAASFSCYYEFCQHVQYVLETEAKPLYDKISQNVKEDDCRQFIQKYSSTKYAQTVYRKWHKLVRSKIDGFKFYSPNIRYDTLAITPILDLEEFADVALCFNNKKMYDLASDELKVLCDSLYDIAKDKQEVVRWRRYYAFAPEFYRKDSGKMVEETCKALYNSCVEENSISSWKIYLKVAPDSLVFDANERLRMICQSLYNRACELNTVKAWDEYTATVPSNYLYDSETRLKSLCDSMYSVAVYQNSYVNWDQYINTVPSRYLKDSRQRRSNSIWGNEGSAWEYTCSKNNIDVYKEYLKHYPHSSNSSTAEKRVVDITVSKAFYSSYRPLPNIEQEPFLLPGFEVYNGTHYPLTLYISGPVSKVIELSSFSHTELQLPTGSYSFYAKLSIVSQKRYNFYTSRLEPTIVSYAGKATLKRLHYKLDFK